MGKHYSAFSIFTRENFSHALKVPNGETRMKIKIKFGKVENVGKDGIRLNLLITVTNYAGEIPLPSLLSQMADRLKEQLNATCYAIINKIEKGLYKN